MGPSHRDEQEWQMYAMAAIAAGHRRIDAIDEIATDALALQRRKFPREAEPAQEPPTAPSAPTAPVGTDIAPPPTDPPGAPAPSTAATTPEKPAKAGKDTSR